MQHMKSFSCGMWDLIPRPGIKPGPPALRSHSLSHWTSREVPNSWCFLVSTLFLYVSMSSCPLCTILNAPAQPRHQAPSTPQSTLSCPVIPSLVPFLKQNFPVDFMQNSKWVRSKWTLGGRGSFCSPCRLCPAFWSDTPPPKNRLGIRKYDTEQLGPGEFTVEMAGLHVQGSLLGVSWRWSGVGGCPRACS